MRVAASGKGFHIMRQMWYNYCMRYSEYKVVRISESGCATIFLGASVLPVSIMEAKLNKLAKEGWQVICQVVEQQRFLLFWTREAVVVTLGR